MVQRLVAPAFWSAAVLCRFTDVGALPKAPEDWRSPKPGGTFEGSWADQPVMAGGCDLRLPSWSAAACRHPLQDTANLFPWGSRPHIRQIAVAVHHGDFRHSVHGAAAMRQSLDAGRPLQLERVSTIADGLAAPMAGALTYPLVRHYVDDVVLVTDDEIAGTMRDILFSAKLLVEPAGAAATAAVLAGKLPVAGKRVLTILSGGNVDVGRLQEILGA